MATSASHINVCASEEVLVSELCDYVAAAAREAIGERGLFTVGLSGGSLINFLSTGLPTIDTDWTKWRVFFCDERHVPYDSPDSTYKQYKDQLFCKLPQLDDAVQVYKINPAVPVEQAAAEYTAAVKSVFGECDWPTFDLLLLGMGPDGHTCSLFPGHRLLKEESKWIAAIDDSPKPPPCRITMTLPVIRRARRSVFAVVGSSKAAVVKNVFESGKGEEPLPAALVASAEVVWFMDKGASELLSRTLPPPMRSA